MSDTNHVSAAGRPLGSEPRGIEPQGIEPQTTEPQGIERQGTDPHCGALHDGARHGHEVRGLGWSNEGGQSTVEYVLVMLAAAGLAVALITWIGGTDLIPSFFDTVFQTITGYVG